jgi:REP element-mobilizing transposase RayT
VEVLKEIVGWCGFEVFAVRVHGGDHVYVFVFALSKIGVSVMICVFKCNFVRMLFVEFVLLKLWFWGGHLWSEGYVVRTAGVVTSAKIEECINRY